MLNLPIRKIMAALALSTLVLVLAAGPAQIAYGGAVSSQIVLQQAGDIFQPFPNAAPDKAAADHLAQRPEIIRVRYVRVNFGAIGQAAAGSPSNPMLRLNLFGDMTLIAANDKVLPWNGVANGFTWIGHVTGDSYSEVVLTVGGGVMSGHVQYKQTKYEIGYLGNGVHFVAQINPGYDRPMMMPLIPPANPKASTPPGASPMTDDGSVIDIMILYTPAARTQAGGDAAIQAEIASAVATTNTGYTNSGITTQMRLVHTGLENYTESGNSGTDLTQLQNPNDSSMDDVLPLRNQYGADLVTLITNATDVCGIAYEMTNATGFEAYAYAIVTEGFCLASNYDLGHETGHNMGNSHDVANAGGPGFFPYSYGYVDTVNQFRTIMAYQCGVGAGCPRVNYYSNETVQYNGHPMGNANADNAKSMQYTRTIVAQFRQSIASAPIDSIGIFRSGTFYLRLHNSTGNADITVAFNPATTPYPVVGDWTGAGFDTIGVLDQSNGLFSLRNSNTAGTPNEQFVLGNPSDMPLAGRWINGATHAGAGVFRPSNGLIYLKNNLSTGYADNTMVLGIPGDVGLAGDWNGDATDSPGVYRPSNSNFYLTDQVCNCSVTGSYQFTYGLGGDSPVNGDWIGQGHDGVGLFRPTNGYTYLRNALNSGYADLAFTYGIAGDVPIAGHWQLTYPPRANPENLIVPPTKLPAPANNSQSPGLGD